ncbi:UDP-N-acetylmuramoyl-tripeptide--D-alanyl-D-alanine ligase [Sporolactobacillus sp. Y61]|uniref:UDP-N-acetylmuramoyl-tripeptide--D-alanyl-D-alanine ligase n=1 Tax=Sporolactobacillus sp. Y61 TaxID=3160863 RepID=A0AAU8IC79_9BACL
MSIGVEIIRGQAIQILGDTSRLNKLNIMTDSRKTVADGLFVPLSGHHFNGHRFLSQAIENGAVASLWMEREPLPDHLPEGFPLFLVADTLKALQSMAKAWLIHCRCKVAAVTGSNGKTTTKDMIYSILSRRFKAYKTQGNLNNHIGVPLTILAMPEDTEVLVLEMGMNHFGELTFLSQLAKPDIAVITNVGESHIEFLGSRAGIARAKLEITAGLKKRGALIIDGDEPLLTQIHTHAFQIITCGYEDHNDWKITGIKEGTEGYGFSLNHGIKEYRIPVLGKQNVKNAVLSLAVAKRLHVSSETIKEGLEHLSLTKMRFERVRGLHGSLLINDCYNASPSSMEASLETLKELPGFKRRVAVLGDMYELGSNEEKLHRGIARVLTAPLTHVVTIGDKGAWIAAPLLEKKEAAGRPEVHSFHDKTEARQFLAGLLDDQTVMLFKASRLMQLETLVSELSI